MNFLYRAVSSVLSLVLPARWNNKDVQGAVMGIVGVAAVIAVAWALSGCAGYKVNAEFEHHSSIPQLRDKATTDQLGLCVEVPLANSEYATLMEVCAHDEVGGEEVFGEDPVGTVRVKQTIFIKK